MILITGATGNTGSEILKRLCSAGIPIRAMQRPGRASSALPGVEIAEADFDDPNSIRRALDGVDRAYLVTNSTERAERQQLGFVEAASAAGVRHIVYLSQFHAATNSPVRFLHYHAVVENAIASSGIAFTHLRPNLYMQALLGFSPTITSQGRFFAPAGDARVSLVDVRDIADVAVAALTEDIHQGKTYDVTGPQAISHSEIASQLSDALGKRITFVDIPESAMRETLVSIGFPPWQADGLVEDYAHYRRGEAAGVSVAVQQVTGHPPRSFEVFAHDYLDAFLS